MTLVTDGALLLHKAAAPFLPDLERLVAEIPSGKAGVRLYRFGGLNALLQRLKLRTPLIHALGAPARPVRAILFDKSEATNWALGWHQDRTIAVRARHEVGGFGPWSVKSDHAHVEPPFDLLRRMLTIRIHLDPVDANNAPLRVALGSHRLGRVSDAEIDDAVDACEVTECHAVAGDVWVYSTPILHASNRAKSARRRRVLHVDYSSDQLPPPLEWLGV